MSFKVWFRRWIRSFYRLMMVGSHPRKSEKQRKKERERRLKAKYSASASLQKKKQRKRRRHSGNYKVLEALCGFMATSLGILLLPFGLFHWGYKSAKIRKSTRTSSSKKAITPSPTIKKTVTPQKQTVQHKTTTTTYSKNPRKKPSSTVKKPTFTGSLRTVSEKNETRVSYTAYTPIFEEPKVVTPPPAPEPKELDENTPKSTPKNENDQYIRKRMIIAGSSYCDATVLEKLQIGTYFDLSREPDNIHDKDAVVLTLNGEKIGYVAKKDLTPFTVCLNLRRNIYGVITDIITENNFTKYEYETWFDNNR